MKTLLAVRTIAIFSIASCAHSTWAAASFDEVKAAWHPSDTLILDRHGELLQRVRTDASVRRGQWLALADISPALRTALVLSEDKRFYEHSGVDWQAVSAAAWANLWNSQTRGASTLTMQLAGLLDEDLKRSAGGRSVLQKMQQTVSAQQLERHWRKDQILEGYLNLVPFKGELVGIDALSQTLFSKAAHGLDEREAAVTAALVRSPNAAPARVAQRACGVLKSLQTSALVNCDALDLFTTAALQRRDFAASAGIAPHAARQVLRLMVPQQPEAEPRAPKPSDAASLANAVVPNHTLTLRHAVLPPSAAEPANTTTPTESAGLTDAAVHNRRSTAAGQTLPASITITLSAPLQRFAVQTLQQHLRELRGRHVEDGAIVVLDNATGQVLAWVGSSGELSNAAEVDGVTALRQPGSALKPFLYAQAIAQRRLTAATLLEDSGTQIQTTGGLYIPQNYDHRFKGWVSVRTALGASLNVPAVRTLVMVSPDAFHKQLVALGLPLKESGDYYGYSLALGSAEVSLLALANAYRALSNGGRMGPTALLLRADRLATAASQAAPPSLLPTLPAKLAKLTTARTEASKTAALDPSAAFIVSDILSDQMARARTFGSDSILATRFWTAVKTGTSKDMRDNWALGYSQRYTVGVWVGNASGAPMWEVSGTSGAAPIWAAVMNFLHQNQPSRAPKPPAGVVQLPVQFVAPETTVGLAKPLEAARPEWFIQGTQQAFFAIDNIATSADGKRARGQKRLKSSSADSTTSARITAPTNGTIIALDPDIPPAHQRVSFTATGSGLRWRIDGKAFASGASAQWLPWPGRHRVQLTNPQGRVLDEIRLEVRGAGLKSAAAVAK